ncbi:MAG: double-strand break repair protein AddB [Pseudomonadota bacterium]
MAPGEDFCASLVHGLRQKMADHPPHAMAQVTIYLSTQRMRRRVESMFRRDRAGFLPKLKLVAEVSTPANNGTKPTLSPLAQTLQLTQLVSALINAQPDLAPRTAAFELAASLRGLLEEARMEGVPFERILDLDVTDYSGHWQRSLAFLLIAHGIGLTPDTQTDPSVERRQVEILARDWAIAPPQSPVLVAGSLGSRGATQVLMEAVCKLPQGAIILPGFDWDFPETLWSSILDPEPQMDHPQVFAGRLLRHLGVPSSTVQPWQNDGKAPSPHRNRVISMALRPAPVTDGWLRDGPGLGDLPPAMAEVTLITADDPRHEAVALALRLRQAAEQGQTAALITPDRTLTRRVEAALDRWRIVPDDSAGQPLGNTAVGRLLRGLSGLIGTPLTAEALVALLKNPKVSEGGARGPHLLFTRQLELQLRRNGPAFPTATDLQSWAVRRDNPEVTAWVNWLTLSLGGLDQVGPDSVGAHLNDLINRAKMLAAGPSDSPTEGTLWESSDGAKAWAQVASLTEAAEYGGTVDPTAFDAIFTRVLATEVRDAITPHPGIMIWGTLEARVQGADLVILAGLNDGVWPEHPQADPWLNRAMRKAAGLPLLDKFIGLSAHDFQQAACAPEVVLSRSKRGEDADTVPSRWLNRLINFLKGLPDQRGPEALAEMAARGAQWTDWAKQLDSPDLSDPIGAPRPAPCPPVEARPRRLSVTDVEKLIRDPYQIYAKHVLRLQSLPGLRLRPDMAMRGTVLHAVFEAGLPGLDGLDHDQQREVLLQTGREVLAETVPWPTAREFWMARLNRVVDPFLFGEARRRIRGGPLALEKVGQMTMPDTGVTLTVKTDRIDAAEDGKLWVYDYKTGSLPSTKQQVHFAKQLHITAHMVEQGAFADVTPAPVLGAEYLGLGTGAPVRPADFDAVPLDKVAAGLSELLSQMLDPDWGFAAQVARESTQEYSDYDHLSRAGEWDLSAESTLLRVGGSEDG